MILLKKKGPGRGSRAWWMVYISLEKYVSNGGGGMWNVFCWLNLWVLVMRGWGTRGGGGFHTTLMNTLCSIYIHYIILLSQVGFFVL